MADMSFEEVLEKAEQLTSEERLRLVKELQAKLPPPLDYGITREQLAAEMDELRASGAFEKAESLYGKFSNPKVDVSDEEVNEYLHEIGTEWEEEMDELIDDN